MSKISRFTSKAVTLAKNTVDGRGEIAAPEGAGGFADYAFVTLHCLRIYLDESYRNALDLLSKMPHILAEIGLEEGGLPDHSTLVKAFDRFQMKIWRVLLRLSAQLHDLSGRVGIDVTFFDRETQASTTAAARITALRHSKQPLSSIQPHKPSLTFTVRPRNVMTLKSAADDDVHINSCESHGSLLRPWLSPHRGVSKDKLTPYLRAFQLRRELYRKPGDEALKQAIDAVL